MDDLLREFLTESNENLLRFEQEIVVLEQRPDDRDLLASIFRSMHTIKGTCGFLGLARLEAVAHAAENVLGAARDGDLGSRTGSRATCWRRRTSSRRSWTGWRPTRRSRRATTPC